MQCFKKKAHRNLMETKGAHRGFSEKHPEGDTPLLPG